MAESGFGESGRLPPRAWDEPASVPAGQVDVQRRSNDPSSAFQFGLASLLTGCAIGLASPITILLSMLILHHGPRGIQPASSFAGGLIGTLVVAVGAVVSLIFGICGWHRASADRASLVLPVAGTLASAVGLVAWIIATIVLLGELGSLIR